MIIEEAIQRYSDHAKYLLARSPNSIRRTRQEISHFVTFSSIECIEHITEPKVRNYFFEGMRTNNWQPATFLTKHNTLKVFFAWCVSQRLMGANPMQEIPKPKADKKIPDKLTKDQATRLLDIVFNLPCRYRFVRYRNHSMLAVCLYAGLRRAELLSLKYADADVENLTIFVRCGKGRKDRVIPMSFALANILREYLKERSKLKTTVPELFITKDGKSRVKLNSFTWFIKHFQKKSGIKFSLHKLRHTFATLMIEGGCDIYSLSKMMGHSDITTTTIYLAASPEHLRSQIMKHPLG